jgi:hypothetical protein
MTKFIIPKIPNKNQILQFFKKNNLKDLIKLSQTPKKQVNEMVINSPYSPDLKDLYNLYHFIILNKRTTVLEFGSGWSSIIFSLALNKLKKKYENSVKNLRRNNPFEIFILENEKKFFNISKKRSVLYQKKLKLNTKVNYLFSNVSMTTFNGRICTEYKKLPLCNPDFIYLDGPDQFNVKGNVNGINSGHKDLMPMICDILKIENFLTPGTIIVSDGRAANIKFLRDNFNRKWIYKNNKVSDQHILYLDDPCLGKYNKLQLEFYK